MCDRVTRHQSHTVARRHQLFDNSEIVYPMSDSRLDPGDGRNRQQNVVDRKPAAHADPVLVGQLFQPDRILLGEWMIRPQHQVDRFTHQRLHADPGKRGLGAAFVTVSEDHVVIGQQSRDGRRRFVDVVCTNIRDKSIAPTTSVSL